jgi:hypothetical protein
VFFPEALQQNNGAAFINRGRSKMKTREVDWTGEPLGQFLLMPLPLFVYRMPGSMQMQTSH